MKHFPKYNSFEDHVLKAFLCQEVTLRNFNCGHIQKEISQEKAARNWFSGQHLAAICDNLKEAQLWTIVIFVS